MKDSKNASEIESCQYGSGNLDGKTEEDSLPKEATADTKSNNRWIRGTKLLIGGGFLLPLLVFSRSYMQHEQPSAALLNPREGEPLTEDESAALLNPREGEPLTEDDWAKVYEQWEKHPVDMSSLSGKEVVGVHNKSGNTGCTIVPSLFSTWLFSTVAISGCCGSIPPSNFWSRKGFNFGFRSWFDIGSVGALTGIGYCIIPLNEIDNFFGSTQATIRAGSGIIGGWNIVFTNRNTGRTFVCNGGTAGPFLGQFTGTDKFRRNVLGDAICG